MTRYHCVRLLLNFRIIFCMSIAPKIPTYQWHWLEWPSSSNLYSVNNIHNTSLIFNLKVKVKVTHSCPTLCNPTDYRVHEILQARILEWVAFPFSRGSSWPRNQARVSCIAGRFFASWATKEAQFLTILAVAQISNINAFEAYILFKLHESYISREYSIGR